MERKQLTVLVSSVQAVGHVNSCAGALKGMLKRGHKVVFVVNKMFEGKLAAQGYLEHVFSMPQTELNTAKANPGEAMANVFQAARIIGRYPPLEKLKNMFALFNSPQFHADMMVFNGALQEAVNLYKPDLIFVDSMPMPAVYHSGIPWVNNISPAPLFHYMGPDLPPGGLGLSALKEERKNEWPELAKIRAAAYMSKAFNDIIEKAGYPRYPDDSVPKNSILTTYACPEELNYAPIKALSDWFNIEVFNPPPNQENLKSLSQLGVPQSFLSDNLGGRFSGQLVYTSLGSMGSVDLDLMIRLLSGLSTSPHKFIVSLGPRHEQLLSKLQTLPANMWGSPFLPQTAIIPHVQLVITHGGNNSVTETFAAGIPMLVLPLFGDQYDNAQRLLELGYGGRLDPYNFSEEQLRAEVDRLIADKNIQQKCKAAAERLKNTDHQRELAELLEQKVLKI